MMKRIYGYKNYKSINLSLFRIGQFGRIVFQIRLTIPSKDNLDRFYFYELEDSEKMTNMYFDLWWSLFIKMKSSEDNWSYIVNESNHYQFIQAMKTVRRLIIDESDLFLSNKKGEIKRNSKYQSLVITNNANQTLEIDYIVQSDGVHYEPGIRFSVQNHDEDLFVPLGLFLNMVYAVESINPYVLGGCMIGNTNIYNLEDGSIIRKPTQQVIDGSILSFLGATKR